MDTQRTHRKVTLLATLGAVAVVIAGCSATPTASAPTQSASETASLGSPNASASATPAPLATPPVVDGEIARALFTAEGEDGVPTSASITSDVVSGGALQIDGQCVGFSADYRLSTATAGEPQRTLTEGTLRCDDPEPLVIAVGDYAGSVQLSFIDANRIDAGWLTLTPVR